MNIINKLEQCSVIIEVKKQKEGSGFLIGYGLVLTCYHVISATASVSDITVIAYGVDYSVEKVHKADQYDVVILETNIPNKEYLPIGYYSEPELNEILYTHGITVNHQDGESRSFRYEGKSDKGLIKCKDGEVEPGMSGGAILSLKSHLICGVLKSTKGEGTNLGGYIVPLSYKILSVMPEHLFIDQFHFNETSFGSEWFNEEQYAEFYDFWNRFKAPVIIRGEILQKIENYYKSLYNLRVAGSWKIRIRNLFNNNMLMVFDGMDESNDNISNLIDYVLKIFEEHVSWGIVITSPPGYGKTTFSYALLKSLLDINDLIPIFIDMSSYTEKDIEKFGTEEWLELYLKINYELERVHYRYLMQHKDKLIFLFESIDEFLSVYPLDIVYRRFDMDLFQKLKGVSRFIFSCRIQNFENYISSIPLIMQMNVVKIAPLTDKKISKYMRSYFKMDHTKSHIRKQISKFVFQSPDIHSLAKTPLQLNMIFSLVEANRLNERTEITLRLFYEQFIDLWLKHEDSRKYPHVLNYDEKIQLLECIAWYFFEENYSNTNNSGFTKDKLRILLKEYVPNDSIELVMNEILDRTFLVQKKMFNRMTITFLHKSFQEYFVASYMFRAINENVERLALVLQNYLSSYVSEFYKEFLQECSSDEKRIILENLKYAYEKNICKTSNTEYGRMRIAREQIVYSLGVLKLKEAENYLESILQTEIDVWVRRGIYIGLSFGGNEIYRNKYVEILRNERKNGSIPTENNCNIGYMLTFFGDQPLDINYPDKDKGGIKCSNMIEQMLSLFQNDTDFPAWRLHLYTLIDMFRYRAESKENMKKCLKSNYQQYITVLNAMRLEPRCIDWPEIDELIEILEIINR